MEAVWRLVFGRWRRKHGGVDDETMDGYPARPVASDRLRRKSGIESERIDTSYGSAARETGWNYSGTVGRRS